MDSPRESQRPVRPPGRERHLAQVLPRRARVEDDAPVAQHVEDERARRAPGLRDDAAARRVLPHEDGRAPRRADHRLGLQVDDLARRGPRRGGDVAARVGRGRGAHLAVLDAHQHGALLRAGEQRPRRRHERDRAPVGRHAGRAHPARHLRDLARLRAVRRRQPDDTHRLAAFALQAHEDDPLPVGRPVPLGRALEQPARLAPEHRRAVERGARPVGPGEENLRPVRRVPRRVVGAGGERGLALAAHLLQPDPGLAVAVGGERHGVAVRRHRGRGVAAGEAHPAEHRGTVRLCRVRARPGQHGAPGQGGAGQDQEEPLEETATTGGRFARRLQGLRGQAARRGGRDRVERDGEVVRAAEALLGPLLEAAAHDALERGRDVAGGLEEAGRVLLEDRVEGLHGALAPEGPLAREHLVEHGPEREDVGAGVHRLAAHLLGGHVAHGAHHPARLGREGHRRDVAPLGGDGVHARQPEVEHLHLARAEQEHVLGLEVAVDDALLVRGGEAARDLERDLDRLAGRQRPVLQPLAERLALQQLHRRVDGALLAAEVVDGEDVRVREGGDRLRLALEAPERVGILGEVPRQDLDRHLALELRVARAEDDAHPALAELRDDLVGSEAAPGGERHGALPQTSSCFSTRVRQREPVFVTTATSSIRTPPRPM